MIVDAHNDLLSELDHVAPEQDSFQKRWLSQLRDGGVGLQVCPIFVSRDRLQDGATRQALRQAALFHEAASVEGVISVKTQADLAAIKSGSQLGLMLAMEGADAFGTDLLLADAFWQLGVRLVSLTWNDRNAFADGAGENERGGLSVLGGKLVDRLCDLGMMLDLVHANRRTFYDVLERAQSGATVLVSHSSCRAILDHPRNLDDEQLRALAARGGVIGLMSHPFVVDPGNRTLDRYVDHIVHAASVVGIEHVGLGPDFIRQVAESGATADGGDSLFPDGVRMEDSLEHFDGPLGFPRLIEALKRRGFSEHDQNLILGANFLRVFDLGLPEAPKLS